MRSNLYKGPNPNRAQPTFVHAQIKPRGVSNNPINGRPQSKHHNNHHYGLPGNAIDSQLSNFPTIGPPSGSLGTIILIIKKYRLFKDIVAGSKSELAAELRASWKIFIERYLAY